MTEKIIFIEWDTWNSSHVKAMELWRNDESYHGTFKQFSRLKATQKFIKEQMKLYLTFAQKELLKDGIEMNVTGYAFQNGKIFLRVESDETYIHMLLGYRASTKNTFYNYEGYKDIKFESMVL